MTSRRRRDKPRTMMGHWRRRTGWRPLLAALALFALVLKILVPTGYMPGTSLARPIVLCPGQGTMTMAMAMADHRDGHPAKAPHGGPEHPCDFAGLGAVPVVPDTAVRVAILPAVATELLAASRHTAAPGRGMAAPPPPSHAPPATRA